MDFEVENNFQSVAGGYDLIEQFAAQEKLNDKVLFSLTLVYEELMTNVAKYSFPVNEKHLIYCRLEKKNEGIVLTIRHDGIQFDPCTQDDPDLTVPLEQRSAGGIGIYLVKKNSQKITYTYQDGFNIIQVVI